MTVTADADVIARWRTGPRWYHVVAVMLDDPALLARRRQAAAALGDTLIPTTPEQAHVTLWAAGFGGAPVLPQQRTIELTVGGAATFASAAYLQVHGDDLATIRRELTTANPPEDRAGGFGPHVTVGLYRQVTELADIHRLLAPVSRLTAISVTGTIEHRVLDTRREDGLLLPPP